MTDVQTSTPDAASRDPSAAPAPAPVPMATLQVRLGDLGLARENLRFNEPADDGVPQLAETILAAGVVIPPIVRAGRKGEQPSMALDGRRRRLALLLLRDRGDIDDDYLVDCLLAETKAQVAAAIMLPNTERAPVHVADVIVAISLCSAHRTANCGERISTAARIAKGSTSRIWATWWIRSTFSLPRPASKYSNERRGMPMASATSPGPRPRNRRRARSACESDARRVGTLWGGEPISIALLNSSLLLGSYTISASRKASRIVPCAECEGNLTLIVPPTTSAASLRNFIADDIVRLPPGSVDLAAWTDRKGFDSFGCSAQLQASDGPPPTVLRSAGADRASLPEREDVPRSSPHHVAISRSGMISNHWADLPILQLGTLLLNEVDGRVRLGCYREVVGVGATSGHGCAEPRSR
jgi:hypothetical protein